MNDKRSEPGRAPGRGWRAPTGPRGSWLLVLVPVAFGAAATPFDAVQQSVNPAMLLDAGKRYFYGVQVPQSIDRAIQLYCAAARGGSGEAQYRLGDIYARTLTGKRDEVLAAAWLRQAALAKYPAAAARLAQWELAAVELPTQPDCVLSGQMVSRTLPRPSPIAPPVAPPATSTEPGQTAENPPASPPAKGQDPTRRDIERLVRALAPDFGLNPELVLAVVAVESNFSAKAQSPKRAQGLMQLIPATARRFGVADPWDPHQNLRGGMAYLRWLLDHFDGNLSLALAGYNAGEEAVRVHGGIPPYTETRNYVRRVARVLGVAEDGLDQVTTGPRGAGRPPGADREAGPKADPQTGTSPLFTADQPG